MDNAKETNKTGKRMLTGTVVSDAMDKTIVVKVLKFEKHPKYGKYIKQSKKYKAHDEKNQFKVGDKVTIIECRPMSREKRFRVVTN